MKILQLCQSFLPRLGGMEWAVHHLCNALVDHGHDVVALAAQHPERVTTEPLAGFESRYEIVDYPFGFRFGGVLGRNQRSMLAAVDEQRRAFGFDVVHAHGLYYPGYCSLLARRRGDFPLVVTDHGDYMMMLVDASASSTPWGRRRMRWTVREAECLTAPGRDAFKALMKGRNEKGSSRVVPNGVAPPEKQQIAQLRNDAATTKPTILMVGRNNPVKGFETGLRAFVELRKTDDCELSVVGLDVDQLGALASELGVADHVTLHGAATGDELWRHFARADIFWMPSRRENMPLTKYEAMCFGLAGVYNDAPGVRDDVRDGVNGLLFKRDDAEDLARQTRRLLGDDMQTGLLSNAATETGDRFRWRNVVGQYEALYEELIATRS